MTEINTRKNQAESEKKFGCETCEMRKKAEANPKTFMARLWRWHTGWCPGWKAYAAHSVRQEGQLALRFGSQDPFPAQLLPGMGTDEVDQMMGDHGPGLVLDPQCQLVLAIGRKR